MLKDELDKHIRFNNNSNKDKSIEDQWRNTENSIQNALKKILKYRKKVLSTFHFQKSKHFKRASISKTIKNNKILTDLTDPEEICKYCRIWEEYI